MKAMRHSPSFVSEFLPPSIYLPLSVPYRKKMTDLQATAAEDLRTTKLKIEFINSQGLIEAGIDGGGLYKEFICESLFFFSI